jgi:arylsulfatase A-like enzyme
VLPPRETLTERTIQAGITGLGKENVLWLDDALGALISKLEEHNILENTIIFFFNDHGQHAKGTLYQGGVHNPSIVWKHGGFVCGTTSKAKITNVDFAPTILEMAGYELEGDEFDGHSFKPVLDGKAYHSGKACILSLGMHVQ